MEVFCDLRDSGCELSFTQNFMIKLEDLLEGFTMEEASGERTAMRAMMPTLVSLCRLSQDFGLSESSFSKSISYSGGYMSVVSSSALFLYATLTERPYMLWCSFTTLSQGSLSGCCGVSSLSQDLHDSDLIPPMRSCATMVTSHSVRYHSEAPCQYEG